MTEHAEERREEPVEVQTAHEALRQAQEMVRREVERILSGVTRSYSPRVIVLLDKSESETEDVEAQRGIAEAMERADAIREATEADWEEVEQLGVETRAIIADTRNIIAKILTR
jgi:predicted nucleotide-binding protein (sugar kinase/HSP70/actin superfamily)